MKKNKMGFSLSEHLISLGFIGTLSVISIALLITNINNNTDTKVISTLNDDIQNAFNLMNAREGLISRDSSPADIIAQNLKANSQSVLSRGNWEASSPSQCPSLSASLPDNNVGTLLNIKNGDWRVFAPSKWTPVNAGKYYADYCIFKANGSQISSGRIFRTGNSIDNSQLLASGSNTTASLNNVNSTTNNNTTTIATATADVGMNLNIGNTTTPPPNSGYQKVAAIAREFGTLNPYRYYSDPAANAEVMKNKNIRLGMADNGFDVEADKITNFFNSPSALNAFDDDVLQGNDIPSLYGEDGSKIFSYSSATEYLNNTFIKTGNDQVTAWDYFKNYLSNNTVASCNQQFPRGSMGNHCNRAFLYTSSTTITNGATQVITNLLLFNISANLNSMFNNVDILLKNPQTGQLYKADTVYSAYSPIKINLIGKDAKIGSKNGFKLDVDGVAKQTFPVFLTSGGLNTNEAWLVLDRGNKGFFKEDIMDGDDLFGDHLGKYRSGYEDLTETFKHAIHVDAKGNRYLDLTPRPWWEQLWINILRFFGFAKEYNPAMDLKLLKLDNSTIDASSVLTRIDLDYKNVAEFDKEEKNVILQRASVTYVDGKTATSADQWFKPVMFFKAVPLEQTSTK